MEEAIDNVFWGDRNFELARPIKLSISGSHGDLALRWRIFWHQCSSEKGRQDKVIVSPMFIFLKYILDIHILLAFLE